MVAIYSLMLLVAEGINGKPESLTHLLVFTMQSLSLYRQTSW
jgi:hypothetical protein